MRIMEKQDYSCLEDCIKQGVTKLGINMRYARKQKSYSQQELAEKTGLTVNYIGYIERGKQPCSFKTLFKIAYVLDAIPKSLIGSADYKPEINKKKVLLNKITNYLEKHDLKFIQLLVKFSKMYKK